MKKRLLIVEDHDDFRLMVREYLKGHQLDLEVFEASSGEMGVTKASCVKPDIVLMDINLPHANGLEVAKNIREDHPECDIIFLTMFDVSVFKKAAEMIKAKAFIGKNDVYEQLMPVIKKCLDGKKAKVFNNRKEESMNKVTGVVLAVALVLSSGLAFAQMEGMGKKEMMGGKGGMMGMMGKGMMMKMMDKQVVATSDGGVVIVTANKISKYDKNLNLVKEVELKMDMEGMHKMMGDMKGMCPMMGGMGKDKDEAEEGGEAASNVAKPAADAVDHASHH